MFNNILTATDVVTTCDPTVSAAADIAQHNKAALSVLHVLESTYSGKYRNFVKHYETGEEIVVDDAYEQAVREKIDKNCAYFLENLDNYQINIRTGLPWEQISKWARDKSVGLIVMGPHSKRAEAKGVTRLAGTFGSTIEGVIRHERCPVMIVNRPIPKDKLTFKKIMVCVDFSKSCESALQFAVKVAQKEHSKVFVFHMFVPPSSDETSQESLDKEISTLRNKLQQSCRTVPAAEEHEYSVCAGTSPHLEILQYARDNDIDLITMGSHTKDKSDKWYVGSAVEKVSARSVCPVVVVTDPSALSKVEA